jgi:hypothetical protein
MNPGLAPTDQQYYATASNIGRFRPDTDQAAAKCCCSSVHLL